MGTTNFYVMIVGGTRCYLSEPEQLTAGPHEVLSQNRTELQWLKGYWIPGSGYPVTSPTNYGEQKSLQKLFMHVESFSDTNR